MMAFEWSAQLVRHVGKKLRFVPVGGFDLTALILDLTKQPGVLDRQCRLRREGFQQLDHFGTKLAGRFSPYHQTADDDPSALAPEPCCVPETARLSR
jgi:hypothetical protein